jgi:DNA-binding NtrC family response regulator
LITRALALADGNRAEAARRLGISRQSLYTRLASLGLSDSDA